MNSSSSVSGAVRVRRKGGGRSDDAPHLPSSRKAADEFFERVKCGQDVSAGEVWITASLEPRGCNGDKQSKAVYHPNYHFQPYRIGRGPVFSFFVSAQ